MGTLRAGRTFCALLMVAMFLPAAMRPAKEDVQALQARFDKETNGERKAKLLEPLCDAQFELERKASDAGDFNTVGLTMEMFRDNLKAALEALKKTHPNARKKPGGYKRLERQADRGIREVNDILLVIPDQFKPPMQIVQKDLSALDDQLLLLLFPDRPAEKPIPPKTQQPPAPPATKEKDKP